MRNILFAHIAAWLPACQGGPDRRDDTGPTGCEQPFYADADDDGWGGGGQVRVACEPPAGFVAQGGDCDDDDAAVHPGADERCDGVDEDCDGAIDEEPVDPPTWYLDADGDGFGDPGHTALACSPDDGWVADATDCDDADEAVHRGADERCDGVDEDCDGAVDEDAHDPSTWQVDADADDGVAFDCDDGDALIHPGAREVCGNGLDDRCGPRSLRAGGGTSEGP